MSAGITYPYKLDNPESSQVNDGTLCRGGSIDKM